LEGDNRHKTSKETIHGYRKGGLSEEKGWGKKGEERRSSGTEGGG